MALVLDEDGNFIFSDENLIAEKNNRQHQDLPRPYKCPICQKAFHRLEHQTRHIRTHAGEKPHPCQFPGCTKRFSRSDELTRHSRIHNNHNSRSGKGQHQHQHQYQHSHQYVNVYIAAKEATRNGILNAFENMSFNNMLPPKSVSYSAPNSNLTSPNATPPYSYVGYTTSSSSTTQFSGSRNSPSSYSQSSRCSTVASSDIMQGPLDNSNLLAVAASQLEHEHLSSSSLPNLGKYHNLGTQISGLAQNSFPSTHTRPMPSSPTSSFSYNFTSETIDHTPISQRHIPALTPIKPQTESILHYTPSSNNYNCARISDIMPKFPIAPNIVIHENAASVAYVYVAASLVWPYRPSTNCQ
jgi:zinc finger protein CreA/MIG